MALDFRHLKHCSKYSCLATWCPQTTGYQQHGHHLRLPPMHMFTCGLQLFLDFQKKFMIPELEIAVGHWPFSDQFAPYGRANPIC